MNVLSEAPFDSSEKERFNPHYAFGSKRQDQSLQYTAGLGRQHFLNPEIEQDPTGFEFLGGKTYRKVTIEDIKYVLSNHYQDTIYDPYGPEGDHVRSDLPDDRGSAWTNNARILQLH